jgi:prepilin-type N-terminal cleavage/methylation domain-containing protein
MGRKNINYKTKNHRAFTVVELIVVIVVIGILAAIVFTGYTNISDRAKTAALQQDLDNNSKILKLYYSEFNSYPTSLSGNCPSLPQASTNYCLKLTTGNSISGYSGTANTFSLSEINGSLQYVVTESSPPLAASNDGSLPALAAASGYALKQAFPSKTSGYYWIKSPSMPNALQMYVDMTYDGGGYDFYFITAGPSVNSYNATNGGTSLGLDLVYPRSKNHWYAMSNVVNNFRPSGTYADYFQTVYGVYATVAGNYTTNIMRDVASYGSGSSAHRVKDGGKWWLRDSTYTEPNGDYTAGQLLGGSVLPNPYTGTDLIFNDITSGYYTGNYYLVSTNAKP